MKDTKDPDRTMVLAPVGTAVTANDATRIPGSHTKQLRWASGGPTTRVDLREDQSSDPWLRGKKFPQQCS
jgi:hypothetical protein